MPNTFSGLNLASNALRSFQRALDTTGHNISNVNTPGYSRQAVSYTQKPGEGFFANGGMQSLGGGVTITSINRIRDQFLDSRQQQTSSEQGRLGTLNNALGEVQSVYTDATGGGINDALSGFFNSWSNLAADPTQSANRLKVQQAGQTLADQIRGTFSQMQTLKTQQQQQVSQTFTQIQSLANKIADLNKQIKFSRAQGGEPNDLLDLRDQAVNQLAGLTNITQNVFTDGTMVIGISGFDLVDGQGANTLPTTYNAATQTITDGTSNFKITGGQLAGAFQSINNIDSYQGQLDNLTNTLRTQINSIHSTGTTTGGATGVDFFNDSTPQTGAIDFDLSSAVKGDPNQIVTSVDGTAGDGGLALSMANLQNATIGSLGNKSFSGFYNGLVTQIGSDVNSSQTSLDTQNSVAQQIQNQIQAVSGVSLDDEMTNMLQFQRSYQAAAKVLSVFDQATQDVINLIK